MGLRQHHRVLARARRNASLSRRKARKGSDDARLLATRRAERAAGGERFGKGDLPLMHELGLRGGRRLDETVGEEGDCVDYGSVWGGASVRLALEKQTGPVI